MNQIDYHIEAVLFDFEGTLVDFQWQLEQAVSEIIISLEKAGYPPDLFGIDPSYAHIYNKSMELTLCEDDIQSLMIKNIISSTYDNYDLDALSRWNLYPDTIEVLDRLGGDGYKLGLVTNIGQVALSTALGRFDLTERFDIIISRNDVARLKPDPEGLFIALDRLNSAADEAIFIGDSVNDIDAASAAGIFSCYLSGGENSSTTGVNFVADYEIQSLNQLSLLLNNDFR